MMMTVSREYLEARVTGGSGRTAGEGQESPRERQQRGRGRAGVGHGQCWLAALFGQDRLCQDPSLFLP